MTNMTLYAIQCPTCSATEMHPDGKRLLIRADKVCVRGRWLSQCLVCSGYYDSQLNEAGQHDGRKGWFE